MSDKAIENPRYAAAFQESASEFFDELKAFLEKHPMVEACTATPR